MKVKWIGCVQNRKIRKENLVEKAKKFNEDYQEEEEEFICL